MRVTLFRNSFHVIIAKNRRRNYALRIKLGRWIGKKQKLPYSTGNSGHRTLKHAGSLSHPLISTSQRSRVVGSQQFQLYGVSLFAGSVPFPCVGAAVSALFLCRKWMGNGTLLVRIIVKRNVTILVYNIYHVFCALLI